MDLDIGTVLLDPRYVLDVQKCPLDTATKNTLAAHNIKYVFQLVCRADKELLALRGFGETRLRDIKGLLGRLGLRTGMRLTGTEGLDLEAEADVVHRACLRQGLFGYFYRGLGTSSWRYDEKAATAEWEVVGDSIMTSALKYQTVFTGLGVDQLMEDKPLRQYAVNTLAAADALAASLGRLWLATMVKKYGLIVSAMHLASKKTEEMRESFASGADWLLRGAGLTKKQISIVLGHAEDNWEGGQGASGRQSTRSNLARFAVSAEAITRSSFPNASLWVRWEVSPLEIKRSYVRLMAVHRVLAARSGRQPS